MISPAWLASLMAQHFACASTYDGTDTMERGTFGMKYTLCLQSTRNFNERGGETLTPHFPYHTRPGPESCYRS